MPMSCQVVILRHGNPPWAIGKPVAQREFCSAGLVSDEKLILGDLDALGGTRMEMSDWCYYIRSLHFNLFRFSV